MRILIIGAGGREHALARAIHQSPEVTFLACLPGNGGTAAIAENVPLDPMDFATCADWATAHQIDLTIIGPDNPLGAGIVDVFAARGLLCLGPTRAAARLESSKVWSKQFMHRHAIPTAPARIVTDENLTGILTALHAPEQSFPVAVKADGLAAGKGVIIAHDAYEAEAALTAMLREHRFGEAGDQVLVEEFLYGREVSVFALCDGQTYRLMQSACDHKRAYDHDAGPNTGGMGAYAPARWLDATTLERIEATIIQPTLAGMAAEGYPFRGFLFVGLMITNQGPMVIEFNARFGDPEAQAILPLLASPLLPFAMAAARGELAAHPPLRWHDAVACGVVIAAESYPQGTVSNALVTGLADVPEDVIVFHAGTKRGDDGAIHAHGGRIFTVTGIGADLASARERAYAAARHISFTGARYRTDIGLTGLPADSPAGANHAGS